MFSAQNQMKRVWDEKLGPSRHLKRESDIPLSHHNWLTGGPGSGGGEVLQKSMFPESRVKGEYMFLDFINKYFIQLSMVWMWWKRTLSCHSGFWMGRWYVWGKIEATKGYQQESARKDSNLNDRQRVELCAFFIPPDSTAEGVQQNWSGVWQQLVALLWAVTGKRIYNSKQTLALNFTEDQTSTYNRPITTPDSSDTERQYLFYESKTHTLRSNKKHENFYYISWNILLKKQQSDHNGKIWQDNNANLCSLLLHISNLTSSKYKSATVWLWLTFYRKTRNFHKIHIFFRLPLHQGCKT